MTPRSRRSQGSTPVGLQLDSATSRSKMLQACLPASDNADDSRRYLVGRNIGQVLVPGRLLHIFGAQVEIVLPPNSPCITANVARIREVATHYDHL